MSDSKQTNPQEALAWTTLTAKVAELDKLLGGLYQRVQGIEQSVVGTIGEISNTVAVLAHVVRDTRNETNEQFEVATARARRALTAPPEADDVVQLRKEVEALRGAMSQAIATIQAQSQVITAQPVVRKQKAKPADSGRPSPADFAPTNVVPPPGIRGDDDDIPVRDTGFRMPASMSFGEGS
jgi:hypothetical protein